MPFKFNPFTGCLDLVTAAGIAAETDPLSLHLDQSGTPQTVVNGKPIFNGIQTDVIDSKYSQITRFQVDNGWLYDIYFTGTWQNRIALNLTTHLAFDTSSHPSLNWNDRTLLVDDGFGGGGLVKFDWANLKFPTLTSNGFLKTGSSDGTLSVDTNTYLTSSALTPYAKLDGTNQPFTGNLNISKSAPTLTLTSTDDANGTVELKRVITGGVTTLKSTVSVPAGPGTGGTITQVGSDYVHTFSYAQSGTAFTPPAGVTSVSVLVVAGGGSGGATGNASGYGSGGGGAGGMIYEASHAVTTQAYTVTVGVGGAAVSSNGGNVGGNSVFDTTTASGGGGGAQFGAAADNGGSGGGASRGQLTAGTGIAGQGNDGGAGDSGSTSGGGGGGGATAAGSAYSSGVGGAGTSNSITGGPVTYAGGGGGGRTQYSGGTGTGGSGGGGNGGIFGGAEAQAGTDGLGGGGGGTRDGLAGAKASGKGGNGVVIIRYTPSASDSLVTALTSQDGVNSSEAGIHTLGNTAGRSVIEGVTTRFNVSGTEKAQLNSTGLNFIDNFPTNYGTANDASISFDGNSLNIVANAVTAGDTIDFTAGGYTFNSGNVNISKATPTLTLTSTDKSNETAELKRATASNEMTLKNYVWQPGVTGGAVNSPNVTNTGQIGGSTTLMNGATAMTISTWVYITADSNDYAGIIYSRGGTNKVWGLAQGLTTDHKFTFYLANGSAQGVVTQAGTYSTGQWYHIVGSWVAGGNINIYVNNVKTSSAGTMSGSIVQEAAGLIGIDAGVASRKLNGKVDEINVWNRQLTDAEVADLYNSGNGIFAVPANTFPSTGTPISTNLLIIHHADDATGTTLADSSGGGRNGTVLNTCWTTGWLPIAGADAQATTVDVTDSIVAGEKGIHKFGDIAGQNIFRAGTTQNWLMGAGQTNVGSLSSSAWAFTIPHTITGSSDAVQLKVIANATQTNHILDVFASDGTTYYFVVDGTGKTTIGKPTTNVVPQLVTQALYGAGINITNAKVDAANVRNWTIRSDGYAYGDLHFIQSNARSGDPNTAGTSRMVIDFDGKVGVGTVTPASKLDVGGYVRFFGQSGVGGSPTTGKGLEFTYDSSSDIGYVFAYNRDTSSAKQLQLGAAGTAMIITSDGKVGIGTTPVIPFQVLGAQTFYGGANDGIASFKGSAIANTAVNIDSVASRDSMLRFWTNGVSKWALINDGFGDFATGCFAIYDYNSSAVRQTINTSGDVAFGLNTASAKLHVIKTTEQLRLGYDASNYLSATINSTGNATLALTGTTPIFTFSQAVKGGGGFQSSDGTAGASATTGGLTFKSGLYTAGTISASNKFVRLFTDYTDSAVTNTSADIYTHTIAAGQLASNGDSLTAEYTATVTNDAGTVNTELFVNFAGTTIFDSLSSGIANALTDEPFNVKVVITRVSATEVRCTTNLYALTAKLVTGGAQPPATCIYYDLSGIDLTATNVLTFYGTANGGAFGTCTITGKMGKINYEQV